MSFPIATVALLISGASLAFGIYQYRILDRVRTGEKGNNLLRTAYELQQRSEELRQRIARTDGVRDREAIHSKIDETVDALYARLTNKGGIPWEKLHKIESHLLHLDQEVQLLFKQLDELDALNEELRIYKNTKSQQL